VRKRAMGLVGAALIALVAAGCGLISAPRAQSVKWLVYGDSLSEQSAPYLAQSGTVGSRYFGGTAPCNWVAGLPNDRASFTPTKVLVQFIGNLPACMAGRGDPKTAYEQDLTKIVNFWKAQNVPVVMIISPPNPTDSLAWARQAEQDVAANLNIPVNDAGQSVLAAGQFTFFLPCQAFETPALGCGAEQPGQIRVRNADGIHFATAGYSSGAERFATAESHS
jgi:hypothetical protein